MEPADAEIQSRLKNILARQVFRQVFRQEDDLESLRIFFQRLLKALRPLIDWLGSLLSDVPFGVALLLMLVFAGVLGLLAWQVIQMGRARRVRRGRAQGPRPKLAAASHAPEALLERAHCLAATGALREAGRTLQQAVLLKLCHDRHVAWKPTLVDWEWLTVLRPDETVVAFTRQVQLLAYGPDATPDLYATCEQKAVALVRGREHAA